MNFPGRVFVNQRLKELSWSSHLIEPAIYLLEIISTSQSTIESETFKIQKFIAFASQASLTGHSHYIIFYRGGYPLPGFSSQFNEEFLFIFSPNHEEVIMRQ